MNWQDPQILITQLVAISVMGGLGSVARLLLSRWVGWLPWGTLTGNAVGSVLAGVGLAVALISPDNTDASFTAALMAVGFAGGLSTFSSWAGQTVTLWREQKGRQAFWYFFATTSACGIAVILGIALGTLLLK